VAKAKRNARDLATALILEQGKPAKPYAKAKISILFIASDKRKRDVDNLFASMKPYVDGLVKTIIEDDSAMHVTYELNYMRGKEENTIIEIEEL
jgi:Holliday junction resolvase RusA-like endonuclease